MRRRLLILSFATALGLALPACSGDDDGGDGGTQASTAPELTTPEPTKTEAAKGEGEKKVKEKAAKQEKRISEASGDEAAKKEPEKKVTAPATGSQPKESGSKAPAGTVQATNGSPPEVTLAVIDAESAYVKKTTVARYAGLLDRLERGCSESRAQLAEAALTTSHDVESQTDAKLSILDALREVVADDPSGVCLPAFTAVAKRHGAS